MGGIQHLFSLLGQGRCQRNHTASTTAAGAAARAPQLVRVSSSCPQRPTAGGSATRATQRRKQEPGQGRGDGELRGEVRTQPPPPGALRECQSRCPRRLAGPGHAGRAIHHASALRSPRPSICILPSLPTTPSAAQELIKDAPLSSPAAGLLTVESASRCLPRPRQ